MNSERSQCISLELKPCLFSLFILCTFFFPATTTEAVPRRGIPIQSNPGGRSFDRNESDDLNATRVGLVCSGAPFYNLCIETLTDDPRRTAGGADTASPLVTTIKAAMAKARQTSLLIGSRLALRRNNGAGNARAYAVCRVRYSDAAGKLSNCLQHAWEGSDAGKFAKRWVLSAMKDIVSCEDTLSVNGIARNAPVMLQISNDWILRMCQNILFIMDG